MPRAYVNGQSPNRGGGGVTVRGPLAVGTVFEVLRSCFCEFGQGYMFQAKLGTIWCLGEFLALISERFRKNMVARFSPGSRSVGTIKKAGAGQTGRAGSGGRTLLFFSPDPAPVLAFSILPTDREPGTD